MSESEREVDPLHVFRLNPYLKWLDSGANLAVSFVIQDESDTCLVNPSLFSTVNSVTQGSGPHERVGAEIQLVYLELDGYFQWDYATDITPAQHFPQLPCRLLVVMDTAANFLNMPPLTYFTLPLVLLPSVYARQDPIEVNRYHTLYDSLYFPQMRDTQVMAWGTQFPQTPSAEILIEDTGADGTKGHEDTYTSEFTVPDESWENDAHDFTHPQRTIHQVGNASVFPIKAETSFVASPAWQEPFCLRIPLGGYRTWYKSASGAISEIARNAIHLMALRHPNLPANVSIHYVARLIYLDH